ncbi:hypothetical protein [Acinetobacter bohemicus]|uniref:hypothetical protein n=1 Tax=Acinetobacter bohemicus TaxID=1435036 RepID=UPI00192C1E80|nr:hypothetical protein [Acinetobacter bohemicus]CAD9197497.1 hypothetical protein QAC21B_03671 [Acinetobacter bohemicus]
MSTKLGTLTLDLIAKIGNFTGPIRDAERQTESSFSNMREHVANYSAIAVAGAAAVGAGIFAMATEYVNAANELETFAFISKTTTQEFQGYAVGAQTMGIEMETLAAQFKDFNEKLGEFVTLGSGGAVDFFEKIAIKTEGSAEGARKLALEMQNLSGPKALQLYVDKMEEAGVTQQQMSFYLESMASDTTNLIPLLKDGGKGFEYWADAAERAGLIIDESGIQKAAELKVQMKLLNMQVEGAKTQFIQGLMPALVSVGGAMSIAATETDLMADAGETLGDVFKGVAVFGIGVYATVNMISNAIAGLAVETVKAKNAIDLAAESGTWADNLPGIKLAKTSILSFVNMRAPDSATNMALQDNRDIADDSLAVIKKMYSGATDAATKAAAELIKNQQGVTSGSDEWVKKQNEVAKATKANTKANSDLNKVLEDRKRILYEYSSAQDQLKMDLDEEIKRLNKSGMQDYVPIAKARYVEEKKLAEMQFGWEISEHRYTEMQKLNLSFGIKRQEIFADTKLTKDQQIAKLQSLREQFTQEQSALKTAKAKELLQTKQLWMTAADYAQEYYALIREEILNTASYSPEMKDARIKEANFNQGLDQNAERENVWGDYKSMMGLDDSPYQQDIDLLAEARAQMLITEEQYQQQRLGLQMSYGSQYGADFAGMMMGLVDSSSTAYAVLGGIQKGAALFSTAMNSYAAISAAWASAPFPYNLPAVGMATMETGLLQAAVSALSPVGMAHDGIDNIPKEGTWLLDKGERVVDSRTNADLKNMIANNSNGGPQININVPPGYTAEQSRGADGAVTIDIVEKRIKQSWGNLNNPNSFEAKQVQRNTTAGVKR